MIYLILGDNAYKAEQERRRLTAERESDIERYDGDDLTESLLADIVRGATLFSSNRIVIVHNLSSQKYLWDKLADWCEEMSDDTMLILRETSVDKRLKATKAILAQATIIQANSWTDRDAKQAEDWLDKLANERGVMLSRSQLTNMVQRAQVEGEKLGSTQIDQLRLARALTSLSVLEKVSDEDIAAVLPPAPSDTVFQLLDRAVSRDRTGVQTLLSQLHDSADPYMLFALVVRSWLQLVGVQLAKQQAGELGIHPYVLGRLQSQAREVTRGDAKALTQLAADLDAQMKVSEVSPWEGLDRFVMAVTLR